MHNIQRKILAKLLYAVSLPYSAMRPERVESNHFAYHLEQLVRGGYIVKHGKQYALSAQGLQVIDRLSHKGMKERMQPHITTVIDITNERGQTLLFKRFFQPFIFQYSFVLGKTHYEESIMTAAEREVVEKTGLILSDLRHRGLVYVESQLEDVTVSKKLCHVFSTTVSGTPVAAPLNKERGECTWIDHTTLDPSEAMPGLLAIKRLLADNAEDFFFAEVAEDMRPLPE